MAHANVIELETCLTECIAYCEANSNHEFVKFYQPRLLHVQDRWNETVAESDAAYIAWHTEFRDDRKGWKRVAGEFKTTQNALRKVNAVGYPDETVRHWDEEYLAATVDTMIAYLEDRREDLDLADERIEALSRALASARSGDDDAEVALASFKRTVLFRAEAMGTLVATIGDFRVAMRRAVGKRSSEYKGIRWPMSVAPDEPVL